MLTAAVYLVGLLLAIGAAWAFTVEAVTAWRGLRSAWARRPR